MDASSLAPDREQRFNEIVAAYLEAVESGEPADREDLLRSHPDLVDSLTAFFAGQDEFGAEWHCHCICTGRIRLRAGTSCPVVGAWSQAVRRFDAGCFQVWAARMRQATDGACRGGAALPWHLPWKGLLVRAGL